LSLDSIQLHSRRAINGADSRKDVTQTWILTYRCVLLAAEERSKHWEHRESLHVIFLARSKFTKKLTDVRNARVIEREFARQREYNFLREERRSVVRGVLSDKFAYFRAREQRSIAANMREEFSG